MFSVRLSRSSLFLSSRSFSTLSRVSPRVLSFSPALSSRPLGFSFRSFSAPATAAAATTASPSAADLPAAAETLAEVSSSALSRGSIDTWWATVKAAEYGLEYVRDFTGLPWWGSLILFTVGIRLAIFPISVIQQRNSARMALAAPEIKAFQEKAFKDTGDSATKFKRYRAGVNAIYSKYECRPMKSFLPPLVIAPIFVSVFAMIRRMGEVHTDWKIGGPPVSSDTWLLDLGASDPYYVLPVINATAMILSFKFASDGVESPPAQKRLMLGMGSVFAVISVVISSQFPTGLYYYWITSSLFALFQGQFFKIPSIRKLFNFPTLPTKSTTETAAAGPVVPAAPAGSIVDNSAAAADRLKEAAIAADPGLKKKFTNTQPVVKPTVVYSVNTNKNKGKK